MIPVNFLFYRFCTFPVLAVVILCWFILLRVLQIPISHLDTTIRVIVYVTSFMAGLGDSMLYNWARRERDRDNRNNRINRYYKGF